MTDYPLSYISEEDREDWIAKVQERERIIDVKLIAPWQQNAVCNICRKEIALGGEYAQEDERDPRIEGSMFCLAVALRENGCKQFHCSALATAGRIAKWHEWAANEMRNLSVGQHEREVIAAWSRVAPEEAE